MAQAGTRLNQQIYEDAAEWLIRQRSGSLEAADKRAFDVWLRTSPEHIRAYLEISGVWEDVSSADLCPGSTAAELIEHAKGASPVVPLAQMRESTAEREGTTPRPAWYRLRFAAALAAIVIASSLVTWWVRGPVYSTEMGEQRSITLADGSTIELNARSEIRVHFIERERDIDLVRGQALFHVAKDATRPFIVRAGDTAVRAVGTRFDVNELHGGTIVTVVEGLVFVVETPPPRGSSGAPLNTNSEPSRNPVAAGPLNGLQGGMKAIFLASGEQLTVTARHITKTARVNVASATAWTQHRFVFDAAPLSEVVDEFNRYNTRQLVIVSPQLDDLRINGFFSSTDPSLLLQFLRNQPEVVVDDTGDEIRLLRK